MCQFTNHNNKHVAHWCKVQTCPYIITRNQTIFNEWKNLGYSLSEISRRYLLAVESISRICKRKLKEDTQDSYVKRAYNSARQRNCSFETADKIIHLLNTDIEARIMFECMKRGKLLIKLSDQNATDIKERFKYRGINTDKRHAHMNCRTGKKTEIRTENGMKAGMKNSV